MFGRISTIKQSLFLLIMGALFCTSVASAAGRVVWKKTKVNESNESWMVDVEFHLTSAPDFSMMPIVFTFQPYTYFERSRVDGHDEPQLRRVPLNNKQALVESVDVGFMDPTSGKIQKRTRFSFKITRGRGFEAGEYKVKVTDKRSGAKLGVETTLTLDGENEVIDRRSMVFETKEKEKKKEVTSEPAYEPEKDPSSDSYWSGGPTEPEKQDTLPPPAHLQENPGACAMKPGPTDRRDLSWLLALGAAFVLGRVRRRA